MNEDKSFDKMKKLLDRNELRRLQKAAREKNIEKLADWGNQFEQQLRTQYEKAFQEELENAIDVFVLTIAYTLHFNEKTKFGQKRIDDFMQDLFTTINMFRIGEYKPEDYRKALEEEGIVFGSRKR